MADMILGSAIYQEQYIVQEPFLWYILISNIFHMKNTCLLQPYLIKTVS